MNEQEIFTPEEQRENEERKQKLIELVASKEAVLIVGAGSSVRLDYMTWDGLLKKLEKLASECGNGFKRDCKKRKDDPLEYVEDIKSHILGREGDLNRYYAFLEQLFEPKDLQSHKFKLHKTLVSLPFRGILTTNYDKVLEAALEAIGQVPAYNNSLVINEDTAGQVHNFLMAMSDRNMPRRIAHLHGRYDIPKNIILSRNDYQKAYGIEVVKDTSELEDNQKVSRLKSPYKNQVQIDSKWTLHRKLLWAVLATRRVVFAILLPRHLILMGSRPGSTRCVYPVRPVLLLWVSVALHRLCG